ncbi:hypothetical protein PVAP13_5NG132981 [Panicum virgatum]|uniref:Uncharacterized protein n=1 Tax=Panicum virgatum TaxID=38727 RepID=A0A8T0RPX4_PANVG|nr:hypothetical protein PVAP13_5NG132981 [Panicum virgatum]
MKNIPSDTGTSSLHQIDRTRSSYLDGVSSVPGSSPSSTPRRARRPCPPPAASAPSQATLLSHAASCPPTLPLAGSVSSVPGSSPSPTPRRARRPCPSPARARVELDGAAGAHEARAESSRGRSSVSGGAQKEGGAELGWKRRAPGMRSTRAWRGRRGRA